MKGIPLMERRGHTSRATENGSIFGDRTLLLGMLLLFVYVGFWQFTRRLDIPGLLVVVAIPSWLFFRLWYADCLPRNFPGSQYLPLFLTATIVVGLSVVHLMPRAWTEHWSLRIIPQQYSTIVFYPIMSVFFLRFLERFGSKISTKELFRYGLLLYGAATVTLVAYTQGNSALNAGISPYAVYNLTNAHGIILLVYIVLVHATLRRTDARVLAVLPTVLTFGGSGQNVISVFLYVAALLFNGSKSIPVFILICIAVGSVLGVEYAFPLYHLYPDAGVRAIFWHDAWEGIVQTYFAGIGYGTEIIKNKFFELGTDWTLLSKEEDLLTTGVHSSFVQTLFRLGGIGLVTLVFWCGALVARVGRESTINDRIICCWACSTLFVSFGVNVSLESVNFLFVNALLTAVVFVDKRKLPMIFTAARHYASRQRPHYKAPSTARPGSVGVATSARAPMTRNYG